MIKFTIIRVFVGEAQEGCGVPGVSPGPIRPTLGAAESELLLFST